MDQSIDFSSSSHSDSLIHPMAIFRANEIRNFLHCNKDVVLIAKIQMATNDVCSIYFLNIHARPKNIPRKKTFQNTNFWLNNPNKTRKQRAIG